MGSWLDSVVTLRDENGAILAENDDTDQALQPEQARSISAQGVPEGSTDSSVEFDAKADGSITIEVADRFGEGGPEYGYRLAIGPDRPDFAVTLLVGNPTANALAIGNLGQARTARTSPGLFGVFNVKPGSTTPINFLVAVEGRPGPVEVQVEGLPEGVTAEPVRIRFPGSTSTSRGRLDPVADFLALKVAPDALPGLGEIRIVAHGESGARYGPGPRGLGDDRDRPGRRFGPADNPDHQESPTSDPRRTLSPGRQGVSLTDAGTRPSAGVAGRRDGAEVSWPGCGRFENPADDPGTSGRQMIRKKEVAGFPPGSEAGSRDAMFGDSPIGTNNRFGRCVDPFTGFRVGGIGSGVRQPGLGPIRPRPERSTRCFGDTFAWPEPSRPRAS